MKTFFVAVVCFLFLPGITLAAESITSFDVVYTIQDDATVDVVETIRYDFAENDRHGIYRLLETRHAQDATAWYKKRVVKLSDIRVTRDGEGEEFTDSTSGDQREVKIGDANRTITGEHIYVIEYTLEGALSYGDQGAEFYWNVTGHDWEVSIEEVTVEVISPFLTGTARCYKGLFGSIEECDSTASTTLGILFVSRDVGVGEGVTIATALDASKLPIVVREEFVLLIPLVLGALWIVGLCVYLWQFRKKEDPRNTIIAQYEPYQNYLPHYTGVLLDGSLDPHDIVAGILYLAEQGFITIRRTDNKVLWIWSTTDYEFILRRPVEEMKVLTLFVILTELLFTKERTVGTVVALSTITKNNTANYTVIERLRTQAVAELKRDGYLADTPWATVKRLLMVGAVGLLLLCLVMNLLVVAILGVVSLIMVFVALYHRRSRAGYEALNHIKGFKLFLSVTDKERFDFHNAPEKSPELFMKYLPYAVALGVEEKWAKVFAGITIPEPPWFEGGSVHAFSAAALTSDLSSFSSAMASSGVSGSSGGGSSGGGGGGGGGGSW